MKNRNKLLDILKSRFRNDPEALKAVYESMVKEQDEEQKRERLEHKQEVEAIKSGHREELVKRDEREEERHKEHLNAIKEAKEAAIAAAEARIGASETRSGEVSQKSLKKLKAEMSEMFGTRLKDHSKAIERLTEFAVGAPNRSIYLNGQIISGRYSDINFIPGTGITMSEADNETTHQADFTFSTSGGGFTVLPATGVVNSINANFTFTQKPSYIVSDGAWYSQLDNNGNAQWSWNAGLLTATMVIPPNNSIYGVQ